MTDQPTVAATGSVSEGTMREEDLIPAFWEVLEATDPERAKELQEEHDEVVVILTLDEPTQDQADQVVWFLSENLWIAMEDMAPEGYYFGAHEGDGSDYGYWSVENDYDGHFTGFIPGEA